MVDGIFAIILHKKNLKLIDTLKSQLKHFSESYKTNTNVTALLRTLYLPTR